MLEVALFYSNRGFRILLTVTTLVSKYTAMIKLSKRYNIMKYVYNLLKVNGRKSVEIVRTCT
jgi:hypothetical protein